jgi:hypothetical protein
VYELWSACQHAHVVTSFDKVPDQMAANETGSSRHTVHC